MQSPASPAEFAKILFTDARWGRLLREALEAYHHQLVLRCYQPHTERDLEDLRLVSQLLKGETESDRVLASLVAPHDPQ